MEGAKREGRHSLGTEAKATAIGRSYRTRQEAPRILQVSRADAKVGSATGISNGALSQSGLERRKSAPPFRGGSGQGESSKVAQNENCPLKWTEYSTEQAAGNVARQLDRLTGNASFKVLACRLCKGWHVSRVYMAEILERTKA